jgi:hypothetical protein
VEEQIVVEQQIEHQREIKIPVKTMEKKTVMVPRQQIVYSEMVRIPYIEYLFFSLFVSQRVVSRIGKR